VKLVEGLFIVVSAAHEFKGREYYKFQKIGCAGIKTVRNTNNFPAQEFIILILL
jgi:hypothetical protein